MGRSPSSKTFLLSDVSGIIHRFQWLFRTRRYVPMPSSPVCHGLTSKPAKPFDLHVLSTPTAFVLSQDQTLIFLTETFLQYVLAHHFIKYFRTLFHAEPCRPHAYTKITLPINQLSQRSLLKTTHFPLSLQKKNVPFLKKN